MSKTGHNFQKIFLGKFGEEKARRFLKSKGYQILDRNYRTPFGELDIVAFRDESLVFVEVKTRTSLEFGLPEEAVGQKKILAMIKAARFYLKVKKLYGCNATFGIISIITCGKEVQEINFIENAFEDNLSVY